MARIVWGKLLLLLGTMGVSGCLCCGTECEVTHICCREVKTEKVVKEGWDVECKQICIPPIHCPFTGCCERTCGKVIAVKRLKPDQIECGERCVVEYKLIDPCGESADASHPEKADETEKEKPPVPVEAPKPVEPAPTPIPAPPAKPEAEKNPSDSPDATSVRREPFRASY